LPPGGGGGVKVKRKINTKISAGPDGGPHSWFRARLTLCSSPHQHQWKLFSACVGVGVKKMKKNLAISDDSQHFWVPQICVHPKSNFVLTCKISEPYDNPLWEKSKWSIEKERKRRRKNVNSGHLVPWQRTQVLYPLTLCYILVEKRVVFSKVVLGFRNLAWGPK
jgi:hypothetical protein